MGKIKSQYVIKNAKIINVFTKEIISGDIAVQNGKIVGIGSYSGHIEIDIGGKYVCPGLIDAHVHIESTMVTPTGFAKTVIPFGTTTIIADPHEIANVSGLEGLDFMINESKNLLLNIYFMLPSCVPAVSFENNGATLKAEELKTYIDHPLVLGLGEMMDYPAVLSADQGVLDKIALGSHKVVDGHSPHLTGKDLSAYRVAGVDTDHECSTPQEAIERLRMGMYVQIREASAARNLEAILSGLIDQKIPLTNCIFCTDDRHLDHIISEGHIDQMVRKAIALGLAPIEAVCMATIQVAKCYNLKTKGAIAPGYDADLLIVEDLEDFKVTDVMINGQWIVQKNKIKEAVFIKENDDSTVTNTVNMPHVSEEDFKLNLNKKTANVIQIIPGQIETNKVIRNIATLKDTCTIAVIERHKNTGNIGLGLIEGIGFKNGAIAQSIAHDSHNVVVLGDNDQDMAIAANHIATMQGGIVIVSNGYIVEELALPIAGLMSPEEPEYVMNVVKKLNSIARAMGVVEGIDPFLTLGFMPLPVIPNIRITDQGLFDSKEFKFIEL
ncbi:MAG TPA: adenine deaminase [Epulopiscium sp.]|nr:adenine deaminase [Candidatus Epulonipiscium sp.]